MDLAILKDSKLFKGMDEDEIRSALNALEHFKKNFKKGEMIFLSGSQTEYLAVVLKGSVSIEKNDIWGNRTILDLAKEGSLFAAVYAVLTDEPLMVDVTANEDCSVLFINPDKLINQSDLSQDWQLKLYRNLLTISAGKCLNLSERSSIISNKTVRSRVMAYLNSVALKTQSKDFKIPFNRQQMADYLNLDRTALSKELSRMKDEGVIEFHKNHFTILKN